jgi:hypothetical protein
MALAAQNEIFFERPGRVGSYLRFAAHLQHSNYPTMQRKRAPAKKSKPSLRNAKPPKLHPSMRGL